MNDNSLVRIWQYIRHDKIQFIAAITAAVLMAISSALEPFVLGLAITELSRNVIAIMQGVPGAGVNYDYLRLIMLVYFGRGLVYHSCQFLGQFWLTNVVQKAMFALRNDIAQKTNRIPVSYYDSNQTGDILSRMTNDVDAISNALQQSFIQILIGILSIFFAFVSMLLINWKLALIVIVSVPISFYLSRLIIRSSQPAFEAQANSLGALFGFTQEQLSGFTEIKVYGKQADSVDRFKALNAELRDSGFKASFLSSLLMPVLGLVTNITYILIALLGGWMTINGQLTIGNLQAFIQYVLQINHPIAIVTQLAGMIQSAFAAGNRIFAYLDEAEEKQAAITAALPEHVTGEVRFEQVQFGYAPDQLLMTDISFTVKPGETVAIVGPTGAGKTTLINLLMRFYDISSGAIKIDGVDVKNISRQELRQHFGMVLQDAWLYTDSIMENIRFGNLAATDYEVQAAAQVANVDHFIQTLPGNYHMAINEEANNVSLGQKQLMTIARAVIADPDILILDEATSSVDTRLEKLIQEAMDKVMAGRTSFVIAHRLSTIKNADLILVMNQGTIIEQGRHEELIAADGFYADLYHSQFNADSPAEIHMGY